MGLDGIVRNTHLAVHSVTSRANRVVSRSERGHSSSYIASRTLPLALCRARTCFHLASDFICVALAAGVGRQRSDCRPSKKGKRPRRQQLYLQHACRSVVSCAALGDGSNGRDGGDNALVDEDSDDDDDEGLGFSVAPWAETCEARPIFVISDFNGMGAQLLLRSAWAQFDSSDAANLVLRKQVRSPQSVDSVIKEASEVHALVVYTVASKQLGSYMEDSCRKHGLQCINVLESLLVKMESCFRHARLESCFSKDVRDNPEQEIASNPPPVFAVSCGSGHCTFHLVNAALRLFPQCSIRHITVCPKMRTLEEVRLLVQKAKEVNALVVFTFASPGMSRFIRRECELAGIRYADLFQPLLVAMELYLEHPFFGISGGLDSKALHDAELRWDDRAVATDGSDFTW